MRYAGYIRVSSERQTEGYSLDAQQHQISQYIANRGDRDGDILWFIDAGESARTTHNRDAFLEMRKAARLRLFQILVVHKFDRLNRNMLDSLAVKTLLRRDYGIKILSVSEPSEDEQGAVGGLVEAVMSGVAEFYSKNLSSEIKKARREIFDQGLYYGNRPFGYMLADGKLTPHPDEAPTVKWLFETYAAGGVSIRGLCDTLNNQGIRTTRGHLFVMATLRDLMKNPLYTGVISYQEIQHNSHYQRVYTNPTLVRMGVHIPLVSDELFRAVQAMLVNRRNNANVGIGDDRGNYLLQGLVWCVDCQGRKPDGDYPKWGKMYCRTNFYDDKHGNRHYYQLYYCPNCKHPYNSRVIDAQLVSFLLSDTMPTDWRDKAVNYLANVMTHENVEARIQQIKDTVARMDFRWDQGFITDKADFIAKRTELETELKQYAPMVDDIYHKAREAVFSFKANWQACNSDILKQQALIRLIVDQVGIQQGLVQSVSMKPDRRYLVPAIF